MPTYDFHCEKCGKEFSRTLSFEEFDRRNVRCPGCKSERVRAVVLSVSVKTSKKS